MGGWELEDLFIKNKTTLMMTNIGIQIILLILSKLFCYDKKPKKI